MPKINNDSYFFHLLEAHSAYENDEKSPSKYAQYGTPIETIKKILSKYVYFGDSSNFDDPSKSEEKYSNTIRNICYSYQLLEFYINAWKELYLSFPLRCMLNKQLLIICFEIEQGLFCIMFPGMYDKSASERDKRIKSENLIDESLIQKIDNDRKYRNRIHLNVKEEHPDMDYQIFSDISKVNNSITILNLLLAQKIPEDKNISLPKVPVQK